MLKAAIPNFVRKLRLMRWHGHVSTLRVLQTKRPQKQRSQITEQHSMFPFVSHRLATLAFTWSLRCHGDCFDPRQTQWFDSV